MGETPQRFRALWGLSAFHIAQARLHTGKALGQQLFDLAQRQSDPVLLREGHLVLGASALYLGDVVAARAHLEQSLELSAAQLPYTPTSAVGVHPRIAGLICLGRALWLLGYVDQAQQRSQEALTLALQVGHTPNGIKLSENHFFLDS